LCLQRKHMFVVSYIGDIDIKKLFDIDTTLWSCIAILREHKNEIFVLLFALLKSLQDTFTSLT